MVQARRFSAAEPRSEPSISWVRMTLTRFRPSPLGKAATEDVGSNTFAVRVGDQKKIMEKEKKKKKKEKKKKK